MTIYLDNAATSFPKPQSVYREMEKVMRYCANPGRSGHRMALESGRMIHRTRELIAKLFGIENTLRIILTHNGTEALNLGIKGYLRPGDHVVTTSMEHNSVLRPLRSLEDDGIIDVTLIEGDDQGRIKVEDVERGIRKNTRLIITTHASNVTGTLLPIKEIGDLADSYGITYMVDAAQSAGTYEIPINKWKIDLLAFPGHKGLLGPQGTGALYVREGIRLKPLWEGGTGSQSESLIQPQLLPDRFESGTHNTIGLGGLGAGIQFILEEGLDTIRRHEEKLTQRLLDGLMGIKGVRVFGPGNIKEQAGVVSFLIQGLDCSELSFMLDNNYDIASRSGLHCAPLAHRTIGTFETGTVRLSVGYFNRMWEIDRAIEAIEEISRFAR